MKKSIPGYLTLKEAEERYGVKADTLKRRCQSGSVKGAIKQGKTWFVPNIPNVDPQKPIAENYPTLNFDAAMDSNLSLYNAEDQARYALHTQNRTYVYIWEYGYYFISLIYKYGIPHKTYLPLAALFTEAHSALRGSFLLNMTGYHSESFVLLRKAHECIVKLLASRRQPLKTWKMVFNSDRQRAEGILSIKLESLWRLASSYTHGNQMKIFESAKNMETDTDVGVSFGPQINNKEYRASANGSIFWLYVLVKTLPEIFPGIGNEWTDKQDESARLLREYLVSCGALKSELDMIDKVL